jgi:hypothetical protein
MTRRGPRLIRPAVEPKAMNRRRELGFLLSASLHGILLIGIAGRPAPSPRSPGVTLPRTESLSEPPPRNESVQIEIIDLSDLRDHAFDFDIEKIGSRMGRLFPFIEPILLSSTTEVPGTGGNVGVVMDSHLAAPSPTLTLSALEMQTVLDASWSRRQRWNSFQQILDLVHRFDPQQGDLPRLLRRYVNDNLLQPFNASQNPEPRVWGSLSVAADHYDFVQFITTFVGRVPSSKVTTELLFLMDKLVQANLQAALSLFKLDTVHGIEWTKSVSRKGAETLVALRGHHEGVLGKRGLWDESVLARLYDEVRVNILEHLIRTTPQGYGVNDARFLIGEIWWQQGRRTEALEVWRRIKPDVSDEYFLVYSDVRTNIGGETINRTQIDIALNEQTRRWTHASFQRLRHFGYRFDMF